MAVRTHHHLALWQAYHHELPYQNDEALRTAKSVHDLPESIMAAGVKGLGQVNKDGVEVDILFFLLPSSKYHIYSSTALSGA